MARSLAFLKDPFPPSPGLESVDPRLTSMADLAQAGDYDTLSAQVDELIDHGIYDIRPLSYLFFARFVEGGFVGLVEVLEALEIAVTTAFEHIGPTKKRKMNFDRRLSWLFDKVTQNIDYHQLKRTPEWAMWHHGLDEATFERLLAVGERLSSIVASAPMDAAARTLGQLMQRLRARRAELRPAIVEKPKPSVDAAKAAAAEQASRAAAPSPAASLLSAIATEPGGGGGGANGGWSLDAGGHGLPRRRVEVTVSLQFVELCAKLHAFERLVEKKRFEKAAIVAEDVLRTIEHFDPRHYFPDLFARFGALFSRNAIALAEMGERRDSPMWRALAQFYQTDLRSFVED